MEWTILSVLGVSFVAFSIASTWTNWFDGVSQEQQIAAKNAVLIKYPNFEAEVEQIVKAKKPGFTGGYMYHFEKNGEENTVFVKYGAQGIDYWESVFNSKATTNISVTVKVNLLSGTVIPANCVPKKYWWSSQETKCE